DRLLAPGARHGARRAGDPLRPQGGPRGVAAGGGDDRSCGALPRPGRALPLRGADHRLHRRDPHALPLRRHARRRRRLGLARGDHPRPAAHGGGPRAALRHHRRAGDRAGLGRGCHRTGHRQRERQRPGPGPAGLHPLRLRLRGDQRAAHHRGDGGDGARPPGAVDAPGEPGRPLQAAGARLRRARQAPRPAAEPRCLRAAQRRGHPRAAPRRHAGGDLGVAGAHRPRDRAVRAGARRRRRGGRAPRRGAEQV
ncbi:MAG: NADH-ubiquinone oxidoreductase chain J, partial [uncultured Nocardioidaceae bacterium]